MCKNHNNYRKNILSPLNPFFDLMVILPFAHSMKVAIYSNYTKGRHFIGLNIHHLFNCLKLHCHLYMSRCVLVRLDH